MYWSLIILYRKYTENNLSTAIESIYLNIRIHGYDHFKCLDSEFLFSAPKPPTSVGGYHQIGFAGKKYSC